MKYILKVLQCSLLLIGTYATGYAQSSHLYLHTDRDYYLPGDTVWFKGYFIKDGAVAQNLHNMYMKLIDEKGSELWRSVALINKGVTASYFKIPTGYRGNEIFVNANTAMDSCIDSRPYYKKLGILQLSTAADSIAHSEKGNSTVQTDDFRLSIRPEGDILLGGMENSLLVQALDGRGYPVMASGKIIDDKGLSSAEFVTDSAGLATLRDKFDADRNYTVHWTDPKGLQHQEKVPKSVQGTRVVLVEQDSLLLVQLQTNQVSQTVQVSVGIGKRGLFDQELTLKAGKKINIPLKKSDVEYGILQAVLRDAQREVISRASLLVGANQIQVVPTVTVSSTFKEKSEGRVAVTLPGGEKFAKLSVSVVDAQVPVDSTQSMLTDIYFQPLSRQPLLYPQLLWGQTKDKNAFIQFQNWDYSYCPTHKTPLVDSLIRVSGQIKLKKGSWSKFYADYIDEVKKGEKSNAPTRGISFGYQDRLAPRMQYSEQLFDKEGKFVVPDLIVFDSLETRVIQVYRKLKFTPFSVQYSFANPNNYRYPVLVPVYNTANVQSKQGSIKGLGSAYFTIDARGNRVLQVAEVTRTRRQREIDRLQHRFRSVEPPTVHGPDSILLPLMDSVVIKTSQSLGEYIARKVPARDVVVILNGKLMGGRGVPNKRGSDANMMSNIGEKSKDQPSKSEELDTQSQLSFLDEDVSNYPYLKFYRTYNSPVYSGLNVLVVFEYSPAEINRDLGAAAYHETIAGYMPMKEYESKRYPTAASRLSSGVDTRLTLYWDPFFDLEQTTPKEFVFYNNSHNKGVWITIQGLTETGKIVYYRRLIQYKGE